MVRWLCISGETHFPKLWNSSGTCRDGSPECVRSCFEISVYQEWEHSIQTALMMHFLTLECFTYSSVLLQMYAHLWVCVFIILPPTKWIGKGILYVTNALQPGITGLLISTGISCPANSKYSSCMSACPASCNDLTSPSECESPCVEGCECLPGYVLSGFDCVPYKQCGCTYLNKYYEVQSLCGSDSSHSTKQYFLLLVILTISL